MTISLTRLQTYYGHLAAEDLLYAMIKEEFVGDVALISSFGAGSALLIDMVAKIDKETPVLFLETRKHFPETLEYVETLKNELDLRSLKVLSPDPKLEQNIDKDGTLWQRQPNRCCWMRKVEPLQRELKKGHYKALITGRKKYQTKERSQMDSIELHEDGLFRINPLAEWNGDQLKAEIKKRKLPEHPLVQRGYPSIGCSPCTKPVKEGEDERAGRWAHTGDAPGGEKKVECGIHLENPEKPEWNI